MINWPRVALVGVAAVAVGIVIRAAATRRPARLRGTADTRRRRQLTEDEIKRMPSKEFGEWLEQRRVDEENGIIYYRDAPPRAPGVTDKTYNAWLKAREHADEAEVREAQAQARYTPPGESEDLKYARRQLRKLIKRGAPQDDIDDVAGEIEVLEEEHAAQMAVRPPIVDAYRKAHRVAVKWRNVERRFEHQAAVEAFVPDPTDPDDTLGPYDPAEDEDEITIAGVRRVRRSAP